MNTTTKISHTSAMTQYVLKHPNEFINFINDIEDIDDIDDINDTDDTDDIDIQLISSNPERLSYLTKYCAIPLVFVKIIDSYVTNDIIIKICRNIRRDDFFGGLKLLRINFTFNTQTFQSKCCINNKRTELWRYYYDSGLNFVTTNVQERSNTYDLLLNTWINDTNVVEYKMFKCYNTLKNRNNTYATFLKEASDYVSFALENPNKFLVLDHVIDYCARIITKVILLVITLIGMECLIVTCFLNVTLKMCDNAMTKLNITFQMLKYAKRVQTLLKIVNIVKKQTVINIL